MTDDATGKKVRYPPKDSAWANPFKIDARHSRTAVLKLYERHLRERLDKEPGLVQDLLELEGCTLGCWCHPEACHGDVLSKLVQEFSQRS